MGQLVLVRHGESRWNVENRFTGWVDVPLSEKGFREAEACAVHCMRYRFSRAFTSRLERAHETLQIILARQHKTGIVQHSAPLSRFRSWVASSNVCTKHDIPVIQNVHLNERYYGKLQGLKKNAAERMYGRERVHLWRRGYHARPPGGESLQMALERVQPFFKRIIAPIVRQSETVLVVAHGNTLRAIIKTLEGISDDAISEIDLPHAKPIVYTYRRGQFIRTYGDLTFNRPLR